MKKKRYKDIFEAIEYKDIEAVKSFLPKHLEDVNDCGYTPLYAAISYLNDKYSYALVKTILEYNPDCKLELRKGNENKGSIYYLAYLYLHSELIKLFGEYGLDINQQNELRSVRRKIY